MKLIRCGIRWNILFLLWIRLLALILFQLEDQVVWKLLIVGYNVFQEICDDVMDECNKHGGVLHIYVDKASPQGNVYVKCPSTTVSVQAVTALHGRWFAGRIITAAYVPLVNYHSLFPDSITATTPLRKWITNFWPFVCTVHFYVPRCPPLRLFHNRSTKNGGPSLLDLMFMFTFSFINTMTLFFNSHFLYFWKQTLRHWQIT